MSKSSSKITKGKSKYFKWGLTAFFVIMASVLSIYAILNISVLGNTLKNIMGMAMPIIDGFAVAYILSPLVDKIEENIIHPFINKRNIELTDKRKKVVRGLSVSLTFLLVLLLIFLFIKSVVPQLIQSIQNIIIQMPDYLDKLIVISNTILERLDIFKEKNIVSIVEHYYEDIMEFVQLNVMPNLNEWLRKLSNSVFSFIGALGNLIVGFFIAIYILCSKEHFRGQIKKVIYSLFEREKANLLVSDIRYIDKTFTSFVGGKIVDSIIIGLICFIVLTLFNMPYTLLISVIIGVTNIIPFFGPLIGAIPSAILILLIDPIKALYFVIIIIILQQVDGNFIGPIILGNSTGLTGFWVIFSITLFGGIWGVPGMFLGVPTFACIYAWFKRKVHTSLNNKKLSIQTTDYIELDYINKDRKIINKQIEHEKVELPTYTHLFNKDNSALISNLSTKVNENLDKTKDFMNNLIHKDSDNINDENSNNSSNTNDIDRIE